MRLDLLSGLQLSIITLLVMHLKQQRAKTQRAGDGVDLQKKKCLGHLICIFAVISDISTVVGGKKQ